MARRRRRRPPFYDVQCTVRFYVKGRCVKTCRRDIQLRNAVKEIGGDALETEGRLLSGVPWARNRTVVPGVRIQIVYTCDHHPVPGIVCTSPGTLADALMVVRAGIPL